MLQLGSYARSLMRGGPRPNTAHEVGDMVVGGGAAFLTGYWSAKSNLAGNGGRFMKVPIPLLVGLGGAALGLSGMGGKLNHAALTVAKAGIHTYAAFAGVKAGYASSDQPPTIAGLRHPAYAGYFGPRVGATPDVSQLFQSVGLSARK